ncbi:LPS O-antigen length regulator [Yersinia enterocolitica]
MNNTDHHKNTHLRDLDSPTPLNYRGNNSEIDLSELFIIIANSKIKIILVTLAFAIVGGGIAFIMPQQWTSTAIISTPGDVEVQVLDSVLTDLKVLDIEVAITPNYLLSTFRQNFYSRDLREQYLVNTDYFKLLMKGNTEDSLEKRVLIEGIINNGIFLIDPLQDKTESDSNYHYYKLSYSAPTSTDARDLLQGYINFIKKSVNADVNLKLQRSVELAKALAFNQYSLDLLRAQNNHKVKIERLKYASSIADAADIQKPVYSGGAAISDDPDFPITMGANALNRKLEIEKSITDLTVINANLLNRKLYLDKLDALVIPKIDIVPFKYLQRPSEPTKKDAPKRLLILMLFALAGFIGSSGLVIIDYIVGIRKEEIKNNNNQR